MLLSIIAEYLTILALLSTYVTIKVSLPIIILSSYLLGRDVISLWLGRGEDEGFLITQHCGVFLATAVSSHAL